MSAGFPGLEDLYGTSESDVRSVHARTWPVYGAVLAAVGSALVLWWAAQGNVPVGVTGYVLGALATPLLMVAFRLLRRSASKDPCFVPRPQLERMLTVATGLGIVIGVVHAWFVATELAKR